MTGASEYVLPRNYLDNNRINLQHYQWVSLFDYLIHRSVQTNKPDLSIADVGTGTGVWLIELSNQLPKTVQLHGLDISFDAAPPEQWLPENVTLRHWNVKKEVPDDLMGKFDVVHIRNFAFVLQDFEIPGVLKRLVQLLGPGGVLQWGETDVSSFRIEKSQPENKADALLQLLKISQGQDERFDPKWVNSLADLFAQEGLEDVQADVRDAPPQLALAMHENNLLVHELLVRMTKREDVASELSLLMPQVVHETSQGCYWAFTRWTVVGRKV